jgi:hypothetical protein
MSGSAVSDITPAVQAPMPVHAKKSGARPKPNVTRAKAQKKKADPLSALYKKMSLRPPADINALQAFGASSTGSSMKEVVFEVTDYFDTPTGTDLYWQYVWKKNQSFLSSEEGDNPLVRVLGAKFYALPYWASTSHDASYLTLFGLPVLDAGLPACSSQKSTLMLPRVDTSWIPIGSWRADKVFANSNVAPLTLENTATNPENLTLLGSGVVLQPDSLNPVDVPIQIRVVVTVAQTMPLVTSVLGAVNVSSQPLWSEIKAVSTVALRALVEPKTIRNQD